MDGRHGGVRVSFLGKDCGPAFQVQRVLIPPRVERAFISHEWDDALVIVEQGMIELESLHGERRRFVTGDILCLAGLHLRVLSNVGPDPAVLSSTSRRRHP